MPKNSRIQKDVFELVSVRKLKKVFSGQQAGISKLLTRAKDLSVQLIFVTKR